MNTFSSLNLRETQRLFPGNETLFKSVDAATNRSFILRHVTTDEQVERSRDVGSNGIINVAAYIDDFAVATDVVLVFYSPEQDSDFLTLLPGDTPLAVPRILEIGKSLNQCLKGLKSHGYQLTMLLADDVIVSRETSRAYLINLDNVEPIIGKPSNRAEAHLARLLMQLSLNCSYEVVSSCIRRGKDGCYRLYSFPKGTDKRLKQFIERLMPSAAPRVMKKWGPLAVAISAFVVASGVTLLWPEPTPLRESATAPLVTQVTEEASRKLRHQACLAAIREHTVSDCQNIDLTGADLQGADLRAIQLTGAVLESANLTNANLSGLTLDSVNFDGAALQGANLAGITAKNVTWGTANLNGAVLAQADLTHSDFSEAFLGEVDLSRADISHADLSGVNLSNQVLLEVTAVETIFDGGNLYGVKLEGGSYIRARFRSTDLGSAIFTGGVLIDESLFQGVDLAGARFINATLYSTTFHSSSLREALIEQSELSGTSFIASDLDDAIIYQSSLYGGRFDGSSLRDVLIAASKVQVMDFTDVNARGLEIQDSNLARSSNIPSYFFGDVSYRNVVMPNGEVQE